jgi:hypothetical protein
MRRRQVFSKEKTAQRTERFWNFYSAIYANAAWAAASFAVGTRKGEQLT